MSQEKPYVVLASNDDGDLDVRQMTAAEVCEVVRDGEKPVWMTKERLAKNADPVYWGSNVLLLIKGEVVVPKPKKIVTEWDL